MKEEQYKKKKEKNLKKKLKSSLKQEKLEKQNIKQ
jgi:hypothetical protein